MLTLKKKDLREFYNNSRLYCLLKIQFKEIKIKIHQIIKLFYYKKIHFTLPIYV